MTLNTKIIIADDHPLFRQALALMLKSSFVCSSLLEAQTIPELEEQLIETSDIDLILLDLDIPGLQGPLETLVSERLLQDLEGVDQKISAPGAVQGPSLDQVEVCHHCPHLRDVLDPADEVLISRVVLVDHRSASRVAMIHE